jgi:iron complex outermembrane receptor protein
MRNYQKTKLVQAMLVAPVFCSGVALAQQQLEEVIVTAERRSTSIQDVPLSVAAIGGDDVRVGKITDLNDVAFKVPGVTFNEFNVGEPRIYIRGIGNSSDSAASDQAVGFFFDEVYIGRTGGVGFDLFDLERIEILRGPQGTLYGKNTNGGAINIVTKRPSQDNEVRLSASAGNYDMTEFQGMINGGLTDSISAKLVGQYQQRDGYGDNVITDGEIATLGDLSNSRLIGNSIGASGGGDELDDADKRSIRGQVLFELTDSMNLLLGADYSKDKTNGTCRHLKNLDEALQGLGTFWALGMSDQYMSDDRNCASQFNTDQKRKIEGTMARFEWDMGWADLLSISAYRKSDYNFVDDLTGIPLLDLAAPSPPGVPLPPGSFTPPENVIDAVDENASQFSQEFRLTGDYNNVDWVAGAFYMEEDVNRKEEYYTQYNSLLQGAFGLAAIGDVLFTQDNNTESLAFYGQADWHVTEQWTLTYGVRWSEDKKKITQNAIDLLDTSSGATGVPLILPEFDAPVKADDSWSDTTNKVSIAYSPTDDLMFYVTYSEGFKSGAFPSQANLPSVAATSVDPENVTNYEGGMKSSWWNNRIQFNVSYYDMDYDDLQVFELSSRLLLVLTNAQAETKGVDLDFNILLMDNLMVSTSYNYSDATYTDFTDVNGNDVSGNDMVYAPDGAFTIDVDYRIDMESAGKFDMNVTYNWKDDYYTSVSNAEKTRQKAIGMLGASVRWSDSEDSWFASIWGKNLRDEQQIASRIVDPTAITSESYMAPRTYGVTIGKVF